MISSIAIRRVPSTLIRSRVSSLSAAFAKCEPFSATFSTNVQTDGSSSSVLFIPPNLKIDKRSSVSPFAGLEKIVENNQASEDSDENDVDENAIDGDNKEEVVTFDDDEDEPEAEEGDYYSMANKPEPKYVIPLPDRLHVPIMQFKTGEETGTLHLSSDVFGQDPIRTDILHRCIVYLRNKKRGKRNGGARTKTISEVRGSGKKMRNQKGGGTARAGHKRPAHWRGGAKAHGPKGSIQNYETKLNKKIRKMGLRMAFSQKLKEGNLILVDNFDIGTYKTNAIQKVLTGLGGIGGKEGTSAFILDHVVDDIIENDGDDDENEETEAIVTSLSGVDINLMAGSKNIMRVKVSNQQKANVYDLLKYEKLVISLSALEKLEDRYAE